MVKTRGQSSVTVVQHRRPNFSERAVKVAKSQYEGLVPQEEAPEDGGRTIRTLEANLSQKIHHFTSSKFYHIDANKFGLSSFSISRSMNLLKRVAYD